MFKDNMEGISTLSYAIMNSVKDLIVRNHTKIVDNEKAQFVNNEGDIYIPFSEKYDNFEGFPRFIPGGLDNNPKIRNPITFEDFKSNYISRNITTIHYNKTISIPSLLKQLSEDDNIYGVILQGKEGHYAINPLHPIIAFLITADLLPYPDEGKLHIFEWKYSEKGYIKNKMDNQNHVDHYIDDYQKFFGLSPDIIKENITINQTAAIDSADISSIISQPFVEHLNAVIKITKKTENTGALSKVNSLVIPHQLVADGVFSPFYGLSIIKRPTHDSDYVKGCSLSPMTSGNINQVHNHREGESYASFYDSAFDGNVCTGSRSPSVPSGWFTLSKVNLNSMHYSDIIDFNNVFPFIRASKEVAGIIWGTMINDLDNELEENV
jgi:hypothetical protein